MQNTLPLNNLKAFAVAAEHLSFQKAAEFLYVTPSAISHQVRNLEQLLGYKLFDRLDKKVRLTPPGKRLFDDIQMPIRQLQEASRKALRGMESNTLALSVAPVFATGWLLPRLRDFYASYHDINLSVIAMSEMVDFNQEPFDASIRMGEGNWDNTASYHLFGREIVAVCHPSMLMANKALFTTSELTRYSLIHNSSMPGLWEEWFRSAGMVSAVDHDSKLQVQNSAQVIEVLQSGGAIGLIDRNFIDSDLQSNRLAVACEHVFQDKEAYFLTAPESSHSLQSFQCFKEWLETQLAAQ